MVRVGFLINPVAGLGGRVGLKGTDQVFLEAVRRGAVPVAPAKARELLGLLRAMPQARSIVWLTCSGPMGGESLTEAGFPCEVVQECETPTSADDTKRSCESFLERDVDLIAFVGGDGTARDIASVVGGRVPIVGVPSGVKMHSAVFGLHPASVASIFADYVDGNTATVEAEILDVDEGRYRQGEWAVRVHATVKTIHEPTLIQTGKMMFEPLPDEASRDGIVEHMIEEMEDNPDTLYLLGPGGTVHHLKEKLGLGGAPLGIDAVRGKRLVGADLNEEGILRVMEGHPHTKLVLSPVGAQGFLLGRGNLEITPRILERIGLGNLVVVATPDKLRHTPVLRVDTGDSSLDRQFADKEYLFVVQGYHETKVHPIRA